METKMTILKPFFEDPNREYHIRELARILKINHTTVRQQLSRLVKEGLLKVTKGKIYSAYKPAVTKHFLNLKLYYNLEKLRKCRIIEDLERQFDLPAIVLFGSYSKAEDDISSDIDIAIISDIQKQPDTARYEKMLNRGVSIHLFTKEKWKAMAKDNRGLLNSICNGIVLSGQLEIL